MHHVQNKLHCFAAITFIFSHRTSRNFQSTAPESGSTPRGTYPENWDLSGAVFDHGSSLWAFGTVLIKQYV